MSVRQQIYNGNGVYFVTFTCARWLHLFEIAQAYDVVYNWFDHLKSNGHFISGYVIMPNHLHAVIGFANKGGAINKIIGNGKRFMAYEIVKRLQEQKNIEVLYQLSSFVNDTEKKRHKLHEVFEPSFDWKECNSREFVEQKLNYIHANPCTGKWWLVESPIDYVHSSANFYATGQQGVYKVTSYSDLEDVDLTTLSKAAESRGGDSAEK